MITATQREAGAVWVAVLIDRNGHRVMVAGTEEGLVARVADWCRDRWHKVSDDPWPAQHSRVVEEYFERVTGEWLEMGEHRL